MDNYEYELPSDFEDEEIDEDMAFTGEKLTLPYAAPGVAGLLQRTALPDTLVSRSGHCLMPAVYCPPWL